MSFEVTQDEILKRLAQEYDSLINLIDQFTPTQMQTPGLLGQWSVRDLLAHLIAHEQRALFELHCAQQGQPLAINHAANDSFNDGAIFACCLFDGPTMRLAWQQSYRRVVEVVTALPAELFLPTSSTVQLLDDSIDGALSNNTYTHYAEHRVEVERWLHRLQLGFSPGSISNNHA